MIEEYVTQENERVSPEHEFYAHNPDFAAFCDISDNVFDDTLTEHKGRVVEVQQKTFNLAEEEAKRKAAENAAWGDEANNNTDTPASPAPDNGSGAEDTTGGGFGDATGTITAVSNWDSNPEHDSRADKEANPNAIKKNWAARSGRTDGLDREEDNECDDIPVTPNYFGQNGDDDEWKEAAGGDGSATGIKS